MSVRIISPSNGETLKLENPFTIQGTADDGVVSVRLSSPLGTKDFLLGNVTVIDGKWSLSTQFTLGGDRKIVAEGFDASGNEIADQEITIELSSIEDDSTGSITITTPVKNSELNLENAVQFKGKLSGDVTKISLRSPFAGKTFPLGDATISDTDWTFSFKFKTGGNREVIADGLDASGVILGSAKVAFNLTSPLDPNDFNVVGANKTTKEFRDKVVQIAQRIPAKPLFLMAVMSFETGGTFSPSIINPASKAVGLIQFLPSTARGLGTTATKLAQMTAIEQLDFVEKYLKQFGKPLNTLEDTYMAVLFPRAIGKGSNFVLFSSPSREYKQNRGLDINRNGNVTAGEAAALVRSRII